MDVIRLPTAEPKQGRDHIWEKVHKEQLSVLLRSLGLHTNDQVKHTAGIIGSDLSFEAHIRKCPLIMFENEG